ncbi:hypothetical protein AB9Q10_16245 [Streptomyces krungchingensis]|uniref:hypothetical protein n=1 Tax=Streptomyces krungchingensis TaxID=1565034 RepID=UPI003CEA7249
MATGPEHYREAERLLKLAHRNTYGDGANPVAGAALAAEAQAHATLALAAATAVQPSSYAVGRPEWKAWAAVAATPEGERR